MDAGEHLHVTLYAASGEGGEPVLRPLECVLGPNWVITAHHGEIEVLEEFRARAEGGGRVGALDSPSFVAAVVEWVVASYFRAFEAVESELEELDAKVMSDLPESVSDDLARLVELRRSIGTLRRALSPHREVVVALAHPELDLLSTVTSAERFAALDSRIVQALDAAREAKESTRGSFDLLVARIGQRTNDIMKVLTLVTVILLPATVLAGIMGMNFQLGFFDLVWMFWVVIGDDARHRRARTLDRPQSTLDLVAFAAPSLASSIVNVRPSFRWGRLGSTTLRHSDVSVASPTGSSRLPGQGGAGIRLPTTSRGKGEAVTLDQKRARVFGVLYLITFVTSIPALALYQPVLDDPVGYIASGGQNNQILFGALLELLLIIANIGTAVVIFPIVKRQSEELALGYVTARLFECTFILVGIVAVLGIVTLQQEVAGAGEASVAYTLAAIKDWTFLLGPGWVVGWGNGLILGYLMYRSALVPRKMAWLGLVGGPLIIVSGTLVLFGVDDPGGTLQAVATIPEFLWELSLGLYCTSRASGRRPRSSEPTVRLAGT